ncbi:hypothetical protein AMTRI_Chr03g139390 [Amborella trichopoda]|uniref:PRELI/MSF1 domain-containing protein n=1 Tax=Amborella trichopoda TaxID=13333 RepID=W1PP18_AMBTC|nr:protein slowmo homolog [Amborella trichopoda]XP_020526267.1 protein slowmo homolog [Amborella trichopoda]XP_020526268.1 protein slowmo homolog [Amborella trichopoda]ERN11742.1 hypothetical protein AMTR_s00022p00240290 [Amborella trichopoda]|eukprot:XP_011625470.1 protein slowmo homolog [Amborella trichopoda]
MVKSYTQEHIYKHPWERVTSACWRKFTDPENTPYLSHILEVDTLNRSLDHETGRLHTTRAITVHAPGPRWIQRLIGQEICRCVETSTVDPKSKFMESTAKNVSLRRFIEVEEKCMYRPHPENPNWTLFEQKTSIKCSPLSTLASMAERIEHRCAERFLQNSVKGREVMERICKYLEADSTSIGI